LERRETGGVNQPAIHLIVPPKWFRKQDHLSTLPQFRGAALGERQAVTATP